MLVVPLHARRGLSKVAVLRAYACCSLTKGHGLTRAGCNKRSIRKKGAAVEAVLRVSKLALPFAVFLEYVKAAAPRLFYRSRGCRYIVKVVVAVSYSPTPSQVQYHRRLRA